jgi:predicted ester cyclase
VSEGSRSFARLTYSGTHRGEVFGVAATGSQIQYAGAALFEFRADKIASVWVLGYIHGLLGQLRGGIPLVHE